MNAWLLVLTLGTFVVPGASDPALKSAEPGEAAVFERLLVLLAELPARWDTLPQPRVPMSGRQPEEVLSTSSEEDVRTALVFISALARAPLGDRDALIKRRLEEREPTEVDLWLPLMLAQNKQNRSLGEAALTVEATLQWTAVLGRRDVLFFAGAMAVNIALIRVSAEDLGPLLRPWVELPRTEGTESGQAQISLQYAVVLFRLGENEGAAEAAASAGDFFRQVAAAPNHINALLLEGRARRRLKDEDAVLRLAQEAIRLFSTYREGFVAEEHRTRLDQGISVAYDLLIPLLGHRSEGLDAALTRSEEAHSRVLLDLLTTGRLGGEDAPLNLQQENERLRAELARVGSKLRRETDPVRHRELLVERNVLDAELQRNLYRRVSSERQELEFGKPLDADAIRGLAAEVGPIVLFYAADVELLAFLVPPPPGEVRLRIIDLDWDELGELVETFLYDLSNPLFERRARRQAEDFWRQLLAPFAEYLPPSGPMTIAPHGPLHELPFEALMIDPETDRRLFERWDVTVTPSVSALALGRRGHREPSQADDFLAFASGVGLVLPDAEIRAVAELFPSTDKATFSPQEAHFGYYEKLAARARHLLIATRGVQVGGSRRGTYLEILPTEDVHDERLSAAEIAAIPIHAELVTLAACDTARGTALLSDERLTLVRSFLIAGATSVLATRWRIPEDQSATRFLQDFYRAYRRGGPQGRGMRKDEALTEARRLSIERGDPAQVWAAWVLVGDAR